MTVIDIPVLFDEKRRVLIDAERDPNALNALRDALYADATNRGNATAAELLTENTRRVLDLYGEAHAVQACARTDDFNFVYEFRLSTGAVLRLGDARSLQECPRPSRKAAGPSASGAEPINASGL